ncbi:MAG TPA: hypothetical protein VLM75_07575 [Spirochaetota bacterium]|nr:hypothetical protein [Spirochaetota bacterium]
MARKAVDPTGNDIYVSEDQVESFFSDPDNEKEIRKVAGAAGYYWKRIPEERKPEIMQAIIKARK